MATWNESIETLTNKLVTEGPAVAGRWLRDEQQKAIARIAELRGKDGQPRNVIVYASCWLQKVVPASYFIVTPEDINGFMSAIHGMDCKKGLTLILHTPGGVGAAAQTIMAYLHSKFDYIEAIIPTYAMSAGTMMALGANKIVMGRQSQLGPIDAQLQFGGVSVSAQAVVDQFNRAMGEIVGPQGSVLAAHVWAPILQSLGPSLLQEAKMALEYGESMVADWLEKRMFNGQADAAKKAAEVATHFNAASLHKSHGKRIDRVEVRSKGVPVDDLEEPQDFQDAVLTAYHLCTIGFETSPAAKIILSRAV